MYYKSPKVKLCSLIEISLQYTRIRAAKTTRTPNNSIPNIRFSLLIKG